MCLADHARAFDSYAGCPWPAALHRVAAAPRVGGIQAVLVWSKGRGESREVCRCEGPGRTGAATLAWLVLTVWRAGTASVRAEKGCVRLLR